MIDAERDGIVDRWVDAVRAGGRGAVAGVLERWVAAEGDDAAALDGRGVAHADALLARSGRAFARLGGAARAAGLDPDDLAGAFDALRDVVDAGGDDGTRTGLAALQGVAVGGWHARAASTSAPEAAAAPDAAPDVAPAASPLAGLDPALGKLIRHDIKTPLQAASLNLELLAMEQEDNPAVTGAITTIMESLDSAVAMLQRFDEV